MSDLEAFCVGLVIGAIVMVMIAWWQRWSVRRDYGGDPDDVLSRAVAEACWRQTEADLAAGREPRPLFVTFDGPRSHTEDECEGGRKGRP